jgi:Rrf2 family protein
MSVIFSRKCEYALQAVLYMAAKPKGELSSIREMSRKLQIPYHFLGKILQDLARKKILVSAKGPAGGFGLKIRTDMISLMMIIEAVDGLGFMDECVLGLPTCSSKTPCTVHNRWGILRRKIYNMLSAKNVAQMLKNQQIPLKES